MAPPRAHALFIQVRGRDLIHCVYRILKENLKKKTFIKEKNSRIRRKIYQTRNLPSAVRKRQSKTPLRSRTLKRSNRGTRRVNYRAT